jgi:hypothetical protein
MAGDEEMENQTHKLDRSAAGAALGAGLIGLGALFLFGQLLRVNVMGFLWPLFVVATGAGMFAMALKTAHGGDVLAAFSGSVTMTGLVLLWQNTFNHWASWAYAWALIAPTSIGLGLLAYGALRSRKDLVRSGTRVAVVGLIIFLSAAAFFELLIGISGFGLQPVGWAVLLIGGGAALIVYALRPARRQA